MLKIGERQLNDIKRFGERDYPNECCGLLVGRVEDGGRTRVVVEVYPVLNAWEDRAEWYHRMMITPQDYMRAEQQFSEHGIGVVGNYHSHPDYVAIPSDFDLEHLAPWPSMSCIIISVCSGRAGDLRSWELDSDRLRFNEEEIVEGD